MVLPTELHTDGEMLRVSGRRVATFWSQDIRFGPYRTTGARRGWRADDMNDWAVLDKDEYWGSKQPLSFSLEGAMCARWEAQCLATASRRRREAAVGIGTQPDGHLGIARRLVEDTSKAKFECTVAPVGAPAWQLMLTRDDPSGFGGVLRDDRGTLRARVRAADRRTDKGETYSAPSLGFVMKASSGDVAAVDRADDGKVIFERRTPPDQRCALATVAAALLLWEPLR